MIPRTAQLFLLGSLLTIGVFLVPSSARAEECAEPEWEYLTNPGCLSSEDRKEILIEHYNEYRFNWHRQQVLMRIIMSPVTGDDGLVGLNSFIDFLDANGYWKKGRVERRLFALRYRSKPLMSHLLQIEGVVIEPPEGLNHYAVDIVEAFYSIDADDPRESFKTAGRFWAAFFAAEGGGALDPNTPPSSKPAPKDLIWSAADKVAFREHYFERLLVLYNLGFPVETTQKGSPPVFNREINFKRVTWTERELEFLQSGWATAEGLNRPSEDMQEAYRRFVAQVDVGNSLFVGILPCLRFHKDDATGYIGFANKGECAQDLMFEVLFGAGGKLAGNLTDSIGRSLTRRELTARLSQEGEEAFRRALTGGRVDQNFLDDLFSYPETQAVYEQVRAELVDDLVNQGFAAVIRPTTAKGPVAAVRNFVEDVLYSWGPRRFGFNREPIERFVGDLADRVYKTGVPSRGVSANDYRRAVRVLRSIESGASTDQVAQLLTKKSVGVTAEDTLILLTQFGEGVDAPLARRVREALLSHDDPNVLAAFDDLLLLLRGKPSEFIEHAAHVANQRGDLPLKLKPIGKTAHQLFDNFGLWFHREHPGASYYGIHFYMGPELARSAIRGEHPSPHRIPEIVLDYDPSALSPAYADSPFAGQSSEEALQTVVSATNKWMETTPEGRAWKEYYDALTERIDGTEPVEMFRLYDFNSDGANNIRTLMGVRPGEDGALPTLSTDRMIVSRSGRTPEALYDETRAASSVDEADEADMMQLMELIEQYAKRPRTTILEPDATTPEAVRKLEAWFTNYFRWLRAEETQGLKPDLETEYALQDFLRNHVGRRFTYHAAEKEALEEVQHLAQRIITSRQPVTKGEILLLREAVGEMNYLRLRSLLRMFIDDPPELSVFTRMDGDGEPFSTFEILPRSLAALKREIGQDRFDQLMRAHGIVLGFVGEGQALRGENPLELYSVPLPELLKRLIFDPGFGRRIGYPGQTNQRRIATAEYGYDDWLMFDGNDMSDNGELRVGPLLEQIDTIVRQIPEVVQRDFPAIRLTGDDEFRLISYAHRAESRPEIARRPYDWFNLPFGSTKVAGQIGQLRVEVDIRVLFDDVLRTGPTQETIAPGWSELVEMTQLVIRTVQENAEDFRDYREPSFFAAILDRIRVLSEHLHYIDSEPWKDISGVGGSCPKTLVCDFFDPGHDASGNQLRLTYSWLVRDYHDASRAGSKDRAIGNSISHEIGHGVEMGNFGAGGELEKLLVEDITERRARMAAKRRGLEPVTIGYDKQYQKNEPLWEALKEFLSWSDDDLYEALLRLHAARSEHPEFADRAMRDAFDSSVLPYAPNLSNAPTVSAFGPVYGAPGESAFQYFQLLAAVSNTTNPDDAVRLLRTWFDEIRRIERSIPGQRGEDT